MYLALLHRFRLIIGGVVIGLLLVGIFIAQQGNQSRATAYVCRPTTTKVESSTHGAFNEYTLPHPNSDLMSPALDHTGNLWFGEMGGNRLGRYNPTTSEITEWSPPQGHSGIMGITVDSHNIIWFAEEASNYIGSFVPATCQFTIYPLPMYNGFMAAPNALTFAADGTLWFTQIGNSTIGSLDPQTGTIHQYHLPTSPNSSNQRVVPYGIAVDQSGAVWATHLEAPLISRLDVLSGTWIAVPLATPHAQVNTITVTANGQLWFTEMAGVIGTIDPVTAAVREYPVPASFGSVSQLYDIKSDRHGMLWITSSGSNALLTFQPTTGVWGRIPLPIAASSPYGLVLSDVGVWFTEGAADANRIGLYTVR